jgi:hypothetical protein
VQPDCYHWKFVDDRRPTVYKTLAAELDAIARGKKPISFFATDRDGVDEDLRAIEPGARKRGLVVTVARRGKVIDLFVHLPRNASRVPHVQRVLSRSPWSFTTERALGGVLGYTKSQIDAWLKAERHARPAFGVLTLYAVSLHGGAPPSWWWTEPGRVPAPDAYAKRDRTKELWRVGMNPSYARWLNPKGARLMWKQTQIAAFEKQMRTPYEILGAKGWVLADL